LAEPCLLVGDIFYGQSLIIIRLVHSDTMHRIQQIHVKEGLRRTPKAQHTHKYMNARQRDSLSVNRVATHTNFAR